jgi:hypothetical protein
MTRYTRKELNLDAATYRRLKGFCTRRENYPLVAATAKKIDGGSGIAKWIVYSVTHNLGYDKLDYAKYGVIPFGKTDFYAYKKMFFALLAEEIKN